MDDLGLARDVDEAQIRFHLSKLRARNAHHLFEEICRHFAQARISRRVIPSTGPVAAGGDGGRDFETFRSYIRDVLPGTFIADETSGIVVGVCTLQADNLEAKIRNDVTKAVSGGPVDAIYALCEADLAKSRQQELQAWARTTHDATLDIIDGNALAGQLAAADLRWIAERFLGLPPTPTKDDNLRRFLDATLRATNARSRRSRVPALADVYQPSRLMEHPPAALLADQPASLQTIHELLARHQHLVVHAAPGVGKSTLLTRLTADTVSAWRDGRPLSYLPVRIHARHLTAGKPLAEAIRDGAVAELGSKLIHELGSSLFGAAPEPGFPWLVMVDGLDEIHDIELRKVAVEAVADGLEHRVWRFLVATRPLAADELAPLRLRCGFAYLLPFDRSAVLRFAKQWFEHYGIPHADRLARQLFAVGSAMSGQHGRQPALVTEMLCTLLSESPHWALPTNRALLYSNYVELLQRPSERDSPDHLISELQQHSISLLSAAAYTWQCDEDDTPLVELALAQAAERDISGLPHEPSRWRRIVHDALLRTGLVVAGPEGELAFIHQTMQEYLAAWHLFETMSALDVHSHVRMNALVDSDIAHNFEMLAFFGGVWENQGEDLDPLAAQLLDEYPHEDALQLVQRLVTDGLHLGTATVAQLVRAAEDWRTGSTERLLAASTTKMIDPPAGVKLLLALSIDADMEDADRLTAIETLCDAGPEAAAAISLLMQLSNGDDLGPQYYIEVVMLLHNLPRSEHLDVISLRTLLQNQYLPDSLRVLAGTMMFGCRAPSAYAVIKSSMPAERLITSLGELLEREEPEADNLLRLLSADPELSDAIRTRAGEELELFG